MAVYQLPVPGLPAARHRSWTDAGVFFAGRGPMPVSQNPVFPLPVRDLCRSKTCAGFNTDTGLGPLPVWDQHRSRTNAGLGLMAVCD